MNEVAHAKSLRLTRIEHGLDLRAVCEADRRAGGVEHEVLEKVARELPRVGGEESLHLENIDAQFEETLANLATLSDAGGGDGRWRSIQIYVRDAAHLDRVQTLATEAFGDGLERVLHAPLCRRELLVEIEGICHVAKPHA